MTATTILPCLKSGNFLFYSLLARFFLCKTNSDFAQQFLKFPFSSKDGEHIGRYSLTAGFDFKKVFHVRNILSTSSCSN